MFSRGAQKKKSFATGILEESWLFMMIQFDWGYTQQIPTIIRCIIGVYAIDY